jgi:hypothetical protein
MPNQTERSNNKMAGSQFTRRALAAGAAALLISMVATAPASALEPAKGKPILVVSGTVANTNSEKGAVFDREMLESLGTISFRTMTPWYDGPVEFEGVPIRKVLEAAGATGENIVAVALNDYKVSMPMADAERFDVILALKRDGKYMAVRDKGPLFIVYPFDSDAELQRQVYYGRSVWQLAHLIVQ